MTTKEKATPPQSRPMARSIRQTIERMKAAEHLSQDLVSLLGPMASLHLESETGLCPDSLDLDLSAFPLCRPSQIPLDLDHFRSMIPKVLDLILGQAETMPQAMVKAVETFKTAIKSDTLDLEGALKEILDPTASTPILSAWADQTPGAPGALTFLILGAAAPGLKAWGAALAQAGGLGSDLDSNLDRGQINPTGSCPVCGSSPYILELRDKEGVRFAHCSLCHHSYRISRLACPSCNTQDPEKIKYFIAEGEKGFRVETCDACNTYIKTIDFRDLDQGAVPPLNDFESLALDLVAQDQGYLRLAPSVWGI